jgi:hypothetical protein
MSVETSANAQKIASPASPAGLGDQTGPPAIYPEMNAEMLRLECVIRRRGSSHLRTA